MCKTKFYVCETCGNLVSLIREGGGTLVCCGKEMKELVPNTVDAAVEKHVPVVEEHWIEYIYLVTKEGFQRKCLEPGAEPKAVFALADGDEVVAAYEHCNLHGLWKKEV